MIIIIINITKYAHMRSSRYLFRFILLFMRIHCASLSTSYIKNHCIWFIIIWIKIKSYAHVHRNNEMFFSLTLQSTEIPVTKCDSVDAIRYDSGENCSQTTTKINVVFLVSEGELQPVQNKKSSADKRQLLRSTLRLAHRARHKWAEK